MASPGVPVIGVAFRSPVEHTPAPDQSLKVPTIWTYGLTAINLQNRYFVYYESGGDFFAIQVPDSKSGLDSGSDVLSKYDFVGYHQRPTQSHREYNPDAVVVGTARSTENTWWIYFVKSSTSTIGRDITYTFELIPKL
jgi:hypothetical protein